MDEPPTYERVVADNITAARARCRLSQREVAERMAALGFEWRQQIVAAAETARRQLKAAEVLGLAYALETSVGVLMEPSSDVQRITLPSEQIIDAASVVWSVRHFNDREIKWNGNVPQIGPPRRIPNQPRYPTQGPFTTERQPRVDPPQTEEPGDDT